MINEYNAKSYCREDISLIENYELAVADTERMWHCHHRDEIRTLPSGMTVFRSRQDLIDNGRYYNCPANELIFLTKSEHRRLHNIGKTYSDETRKKMSEAAKGKKKKPFSEEHRKHLSESGKGRHYKLSEETKKRISEARKGVPTCTGKHWKLVDGKRVWY